MEILEHLNIISTNGNTQEIFPYNTIKMNSLNVNFLQFNLKDNWINDRQVLINENGFYYPSANITQDCFQLETTNLFTNFLTINNPFNYSNNFPVIKNIFIENKQLSLTILNNNLISLWNFDSTYGIILKDNNLKFPELKTNNLLTQYVENALLKNKITFKKGFYVDKLILN